MARAAGFDGFGAGSELDWDAIRAIFDGMRDYMCIHRAVLDGSGNVVDCELLTWNQSYERVRTKEVLAGQRLMDTYFEPEGALMYVNEAWRNGRAHQFFELNASTRDQYRPDGAVVRIEVEWQRTGPYIVEIGSDMSEFQVIQMRLAAQEAESTALEMAATLAEDRERIARDLHDTVIQQLFALSLSARDMAAVTGDPGHAARLLGMSTTLTSLIEEIRSEIFDVRHRGTTTVREELDEMLGAARDSGSARIEVRSGVGTLPLRHMANIRAVVREAVSNSLRHGRASEVDVSVELSDGIVTVRVSDNGQGLPPARERSSGLSNMQKRAELLGGTFSVTSTPGSGAELLWKVPVFGQDSVHEYPREHPGGPVRRPPDGPPGTR